MNKKYPYLDLLDVKLDEQQQKVCCTLENTVVGAGAGSGKTQVLATRFAWLVMEFDNIKASSILTLTFTKKAAGEMYSRIYNTLKFFATNEKVPERQKKNAKRALEDFANVHIQTLDSYCVSIVRQAANRYGIRPDFTSDEGSLNSIISKLAFEFTVKNKERSSIKFFAETGKLEDFAYNVLSKIIIKHTSLATEKNYFFNTLEVQKGIQMPVMVRLLHDDLPNLISTLILNCNEVLEYVSLKKEKDEVDFLYFLNELETTLSFIEDINDIFSGDIVSFEEKLYMLESNLLNLLKCNAGKSKKRSEAIKELKENVKTLSSILEKEFCPICNYIKNYEYIKDMQILLDEFLEICNEQKRLSGFLSFKDISDMALKILIEQKDIRNQEKNAFSKIMIDEFQDNNGKNRDLLFLISEKTDVFTNVERSLKKNSDGPYLKDLLKPNLEKEKLFFVGDEKQSIYKFRDADVSVFNELKNDLAQINSENENADTNESNTAFLNMVYNYRSENELIESFNKLFGAFEYKNDDYIFNESTPYIFEEESKEAYHATYSYNSLARTGKKSNETSKNTTKNNEAKMHVALFPYIDNSFDEENLSKKENVAYYIAKKIQDIYKNGNRYSRIAILERSRKDRKYITSYLEKFNIPYTVDSHLSLFEDGPANDIYNFLRLCVYPQDSHAFASHLASPFANLSTSSVQSIIFESFCKEEISNEEVAKNSAGEGNNFQNNKNEFLPIFLINSEIEKSISAKELSRYKKARDFYIENKNDFLSMPITDSITKLWYDCAYRYETLINKNCNMFAEHYDLLFALAKEMDRVGESLASFVDSLSLIKQNQDEDLLNDISFPVEKEDAVNIMTIHKSKGLQFDYVFVLGCIKESSGGNNNREAFFFDEKTGISLAANKDNFFYLMQKDENKKKDNAEFKRLIYVALTRAIKECFIANTYKITKKKNANALHENSPLDKIIEYYYPDFTTSEYEDKFNSTAPFDIIRIKEQNKEDIKNEYQKTSNLQNLKVNKIESVEKIFENAHIILSTFNTINHITPSSTEEGIIADSISKSSDDVYKSISEFGQYKDMYSELDKIFEKSKNVLTPTMFGTLVHYFLELCIQGNGFEGIKKNASKIVKSLSASLQQELFLICQKICTVFFDTDYGMFIRSLQSSSGQENDSIFLKTEYEFKLFYDTDMVTGIIDLVFRYSNGRYVIIDYKTDKSIAPELYTQQQAYYRKAISELRQVNENEIDVFLYYVRYNQFVRL